MNEIAIYGAGGLGREVACLIRRINEVAPEWNFIGFFDDSKEPGSEVEHFGKCFGGIKELNNWNNPLFLVLAFGNPRTLAQVYNKIINPNITFPNLFDPSFITTDPDSFEIGHGNIIQIGTYLTTNVSLGNFNLLNGSVAIGHDTKIGDYNVFMPGCKISGEVKIGKGNLFGAQSFVMQRTTIGAGVTLSPLSSLLKNPKDNSIYIGNPAKKFNI